VTRPRIWHFVYDDPRNPWVGGGGAVRAWEVYRRLQERFEVTVWYGAYPGARAEWREGVRYRPLGAPAPYAWSRWTFARAASRKLREGGYDVAVVEHSPYTPLRAPRNPNVVAVVHHLTGPTAERRWGVALGRIVRGWERRQLRRYAAIAATSQATAQALVRLGVRAPIVVVPAGVDDALFAMPRRREVPAVLYIGRLDAFQKGLDVLLEAFAAVARRSSGVRLWIAGRGRDRATLARCAEELGIGRRIRWWGAVSERGKRRLLAHASVFVQPSRFEGFGIAAAEAMAVGLPVVASAVDSLPEVVQPPEGGLVVPPEDPTALASALERLLCDADCRRALGQGARRIAERFRWDAVADSFAAFLEERLAQRGNPNP